MRLILTIVMGLGLGLVGLMAPAQAQRVYSAAPPASQLETAPVVLVDIRRPEEWQATGVLPNAILLTLNGPDDVARFAEALRPHLRPGLPVALICRTGNRTGIAAPLLAQALDVPVIDVTGGITRLIGQGYTPARPTRAQGCATC